LAWWPAGGFAGSADHVDERTITVKRSLRLAPSSRWLALIVLLAVGGGVLGLGLLHRGEPRRATRASTTPASRPPALPDEAAAPSAPSATAAETPPAPVSIRIEAIGASAPVDPLGLNADGTLQVPTDFSRTGYYTGRPPPGEVGPAIIVAHVDSKTGPAVFYRLRDLKPGDEVVVTLADESEVVFAVDRLEQHPKKAFPTKAVYDPTPGATLRLITCGGSFDKASGHYRDNLVAFAHLKGRRGPSGNQAAQPVMRAKMMTLSR
jgi:sortase (surface protein transpeptidase)